MLAPEDAKVVRMVYNRFLENEVEGWTTIDDILEILEYLTDEELIIQVKVRMEEHKKGIRCKKEHEQSNCFAPFVYQAVESILTLEDLHPKNAYVLSYYLAMSEMGLILPIS